MTTQHNQTYSIKAIIGLGNPGNKFVYTRHNIGFRVVDALADKYHGSWRAKENMQIATIDIAGHPILLIKPQTYMNNSGQVIPYLTKQGIKAENILVVHDELEIPFGKMKIKMGGSHKGHNGLKSIIGQIGPDFVRFNFGIGRPVNKEDVPDYVLQNFDQPSDEVERLIEQAVMDIAGIVSTI